MCADVDNTGASMQSLLQLSIITNMGHGRRRASQRRDDSN